MNQVIDALVDKEALAITILLRAEKVGHAPMRRDQSRYHQELLNDLKEQRAKLIFGRMSQGMEAERKYAGQFGQQRMHSIQDFPNGPDDRRVVNKARQSINSDIDRIKVWLNTEHCLQGKEGDELINAAVEFFHNFRER